MAKYFHTVHFHPFSWDMVAETIFRRYPNPFSNHVLSEDTFHRELLANNVLYTRRFFTKTNKMPKWGEKFIGESKRYVPLVEESYVNPLSKEIVTYTRNVCWNFYMTSVEKVRYLPSNHPDAIKASANDAANTTVSEDGGCVAIKEAWIESSLYGLRSAVKNYGIKKFKENCIRATDGFNHVLKLKTNIKDLSSELRKLRSHNTLKAEESFPELNNFKSSSK